MGGRRRNGFESFSCEIFSFRNTRFDFILWRTIKLNIGRFCADDVIKPGVYVLSCASFKGNTTVLEMFRRCPKVTNFTMIPSFFHLWWSALFRKRWCYRKYFYGMPFFLILNCWNVNVGVWVFHQKDDIIFKAPSCHKFYYHSSALLDQW